MNDYLIYPFIPAKELTVSKSTLAAIGRRWREIEPRARIFAGPYGSPRQFCDFDRELHKKHVLYLLSLRISLWQIRKHELDNFYIPGYANRIAMFLARRASRIPNPNRKKSNSRSARLGRIKETY